MLNSPIAYALLQRAMGGHRARQRFVLERVRPYEGMRVLDIGCGPATILAYLPAVDYHGFDLSARYVESARRRFGERGRFFCGEFEGSQSRATRQFDLVLAMGLLHHLGDAAAVNILQLARTALRNGGRLLTVDPCFCADQNPIARFLIAHDRGHHVRREEEYMGVVKQVFPSARCDLEHRAWPPYTHIFMECRKD